MTVNYAAVMGIIKDARLPSNGFSNIAVAFYVSFFFFEPIQTFCIQKFPVAKWLGASGMFVLIVVQALISQV